MSFPLELVVDPSAADFVHISVNANVQVGGRRPEAVHAPLPVAARVRDRVHIVPAEFGHLNHFNNIFWKIEGTEECPPNGPWLSPAGCRAAQRVRNRQIWVAENIEKKM
jgi:hypothetical protein